MEQAFQAIVSVVFLVITAWLVIDIVRTFKKHQEAPCLCCGNGGAKKGCPLCGRVNDE